MVKAADNPARMLEACHDQTNRQRHILSITEVRDCYEGELPVGQDLNDS